MDKGLESFQTTAQESSPYPRFSNAKIGLYNDEKTPALRSPDETSWYDSGIGVEEDHHSAKAVPFQPQLLPTFGNPYEMGFMHPRTSGLTIDGMAATTHGVKRKRDKSH